MTDTLIASIISIVGILISVTVSVMITRAQNKVELEKIKKHLEQEYAKSLFDKRVEVYPQLHDLLSSYGKTIQYNKQNVKNLLNFRDAVDKWNSQYSIFFTRPTARLSSRFRKYLISILEKGMKSKISQEDWNTIDSILGHFEMSIKSEIGVTSIEPASNITGLDDVYKFIEGRIKDKTL